MPRSRVLSRAATCALAAGICLALVPGVATATPARTSTPAPTPTPTLTPADDLLAAPTNGTDALAALGDELDVAARRNDLTPAALGRLLRTDPTAWLTSEGKLLHIDPAPRHVKRAPAPSSAPGTTPGAAPVSNEAPLEETFALHSNPGASLSIFLDFDGATVSGTQWNAQYGVGTSHPAWDPRGNGAAFDDVERRAVQKVWAMVAEDYAAFDVDVTTEDPGPSGLTRADAADGTYGTRALITPSPDAWEAICSRQCGGVAFVDVYDAIGTAYQPAWVFPGGLGNSAKYVAEATSHEVGHNLALGHDGNSRIGYDAGHGSWAPIMGVGYDRPITQWSKGDYPDANNHQDDLAIIGGLIPRRADEAGGTPGDAAALPAAGVTSYVTTRADVDAYRLGTCQPGATAAVTPAPTSPDLDVRAWVVDADGTVVASADPASATVDIERASGMDAALTVPVGGEGHVLLVDGVGQGTWATGYDDYASIGAYTVAVSGCTEDATALPGAPTEVTATAHATDAEITVTWSPPAQAGAGPVTGYVVSAAGSATTLGADARSHTLTGLAPGTTYDVTLNAVNATGTGPGRTVSATTAAAPVDLPGAPLDLTADWNRTEQRTEVFWNPPTDDGGAPITAYRLSLDGTSVGELGGDATGAYLTGALDPGTHTVTVRAVNEAGAGAPAQATFTVVAAPANDDADDAQLLTGDAGSVDGDNADATAADDDPTPPGAEVGAGGHSVWYSWTAPAAGSTTFRTTSDVAVRDTTLGVYTGARGALVLVADNDDADSLLSRVEFRATPGTTYWIVVDSFDTTDSAGPFGLEWQLTRDPVEPVDTEAPVASDLDFSPRSVDVGDGPRQVAVTVRLTDATGVRSPTVALEADDDSGAGDRLDATLTRTSGTARDGVYQGSLTVPATAATGPWTLTLQPVSDTLDHVAAPVVHPARLQVSRTPPATAPDAPTGVVATAGDASATVSWTASAVHGSPVTGYTVTAQPGGSTRAVDAATRSTTLSGLTNGTAYSFSVVATSAVGDSPASVATEPVTPLAPAARPDRVARPTAVVRGDRAIVRWRPAGDNGSPVNRYLLRVSRAPGVSVGPGRTRVVLRDLRRGVHRIRVVARNEVGLSRPSAPVWVRIRR